LGTGFDLMGLNFPYFRSVVTLAVIRIVVKGELSSVRFNKVDLTVFILCIAMMVASLFQSYSPGSGPVYMAGVVLNIGGSYLAFRVMASSGEVLESIIGNLPWFLLPVALLMVLEQTLHTNYFSLISPVSAAPLVREGRIRSMGPFSHPILAGTIGATFLPYALMFGWKKPASLLLIAVSLVLVFTSASSGPLVSLIVVLLFLSMWRYRRFLRLLYLAPLILYMLLLVIMNRAPYYLLGEIDLAGGSTGWYRGFLIESTLEHFSEWWLFGTDYTLHWIPFQSGSSDKHSDITNYFVIFAIHGGLPALFLFLQLNWQIYRIASQELGSASTMTMDEQWQLFAFTASFFGYLGTFFSVSLFGQAQVFYWMLLALVSNLYSRNKESVNTVVLPTSGQTEP
jgi:hypothetical protein